MAFIRWYVRGPSDSHEYGAWHGALRYCATCKIDHECPLGQSWHIEGPEVDVMLCSVRIDTDEGDVRSREPKRVCPRCVAVARRQEAL